jgi:radical SAM protein with 4Fe4S-binding SPASM domain
MELIVKPTQACNFKCTFCSSTEIAEKDATILDHQYIFDFLTRFPNTSSIIINGGDPLMLPPDYYWQIIKFLDDHNLPASISLTTNLWAFYKKPDIWEALFKHPRVGVCTSFNYGNTRRVTKSLVYTEDLFWKVSNTMLRVIGYRPDFISVITEENEDTAIDNVLLAKKMNVECKLNYAMSSGLQDKPYILGNIYKKYVEIYELGLSYWEFNTKQMLKRIGTGHTICPQSRECDSNIRALNPEGDYYSCGSIADDMQYPISFEEEVINGKFFRPLNSAVELSALKEECYSCSMFKICNGCYKTIKDLKQSDSVEEHCAIMKSMEHQILALNANHIIGDNIHQTVNTIPLVQL